MLIEKLRSAKRIVIKIGSATLCTAEGQVNTRWLKSLVQDVMALKAQGTEIIIVCSGAVALGKEQLGIKRALKLDEKQAASSVGQVALSQEWQTAFAPFNVAIGQILITLDDTENRKRYLNSIATFSSLLSLGVVPLVNENDTVATSEIRYGDNDRLAAHIAQLTQSDLLIMLSDIDGVYDKNPRKHKDAQHFTVIDRITDAIKAAAAGPNEAANMGSGGMASKIEAAEIALQAGCSVIIASGENEKPIDCLLKGAKGTLFPADSGLGSARKKWIAGKLQREGKITVDEGACAALQAGKSLLPSGIVAIEGDFMRGDAVDIISPHGKIIACGLSAFSHEEVLLIAGKQSSQLAAILGYDCRPAVIEKSNLVLASN